MTEIDQDRTRLLVEVGRLVIKWQPKLRLQDWTISCKVDDPGDKDWAASSTADWVQKCALLRVRADYGAWVEDRRPGHYTHAADLEHTIVRELLHIVEQPICDQLDDEMIWAFGKGADAGLVGHLGRRLWRDYREWWVNHLARTLIEADRKTGAWSEG